MEEQQRIWINNRSPRSSFCRWKLLQILSPCVLSALPPPPPATADHPLPASCFPWSSFQRQKVEGGLLLLIHILWGTDNTGRERIWSSLGQQKVWLGLLVIMPILYTPLPSLFSVTDFPLPLPPFPSNSPESSFPSPLFPFFPMPFFPSPIPFLPTSSHCPCPPLPYPLTFPLCIHRTKSPCPISCPLSQSPFPSPSPISLFPLSLLLSPHPFFPGLPSTHLCLSPPPFPISPRPLPLSY